MELTIRPRRLRSSDSLRHMVRETRMSPDSLIYPIFVDETLSGRRPIPSLEGQYHYGLDCVCDAVRECLEAGVGRCILFTLACPPARTRWAPPPGTGRAWSSRPSAPSRPHIRTST